MRSYESMQRAGRFANIADNYKRAYRARFGADFIGKDGDMTIACICDTHTVDDVSHAEQDHIRLDAMYEHMHGNPPADAL